MITISMEIPETLAARLRACAEREGITMEQLLSSAAAEKVSALATLAEMRERALRARREDFIAFLDGSPSSPAVEDDGLPKI